MQETLYIVEITEDGRHVIVFGTLTKEADFYVYTPYNHDKKKFHYPNVVIKSKEMPAMAERRLYSSRRSDIQEILAKYGLQSYDKWELLKRTKGQLLTDRIQYLTKEALNELISSDQLATFIGIDE